MGAFCVRPGRPALPRARRAQGSKWARRRWSGHISPNSPARRLAWLFSCLCLVSFDPEPIPLLLAQRQENDGLAVDTVKDAKTIVRTEAQLPLGFKGERLFQGLAIPCLYLCVV